MKFQYAEYKFHAKNIKKYVWEISNYATLVNTNICNQIGRSTEHLHDFTVTFIK